MELRIVQVGSHFVIAGFDHGSYVLNPTAGGHQTAHRNPRTLLDGTPRQHIYDSAGDAERAFRDRYDVEPVWDLYSDGPQDGKAISLGDAARSLGVDAATLRNQIHNRSLAGYKIGRNWVISGTELERYRRENLGAVGRKPNPPA